MIKFIYIEDYLIYGIFKKDGIGSYEFWGTPGYQEEWELKEIDFDGQEKQIMDACGLYTYEELYNLASTKLYEKII